MSSPNIIIDIQPVDAPPVARRGRTAAGGRWAPVVEQLRASPGQWFKVANIDRPAKSTAGLCTSLRSAGLKFVMRTVEGGTDIYAMYPGEEVTA